MLKSFIKKFFSKEKYDFETLEGIQNIPIPKYKPLQGMSSPVNNVEYILQKKATEHKKNGRMDLAIACLRKANEIFPYSNFAWLEKDYMRLVEYLKLNRQFEEARKEEQKIKEMFQYSRAIFEGKRIFSIDGKDKRFPMLPDCIKFIIITINIVRPL